MKAAQVSKPGGNFEVVERPVPEPGRAQVRIKVEACGVCHSDAIVKESGFPGLQYPRDPGHEIAGRIDAVGPDVTQWKPGQRVGVGWHGGHCFKCDPCRRGHFILCQFEKITGVSFDGGYAEYLVVPVEAVATMPDDLPADEAAPLLCAGITVFNSMRHAGATAGDLVAVQGIGGLGHLGVQFARQMGFRTVAIGRGGDKEALAKKLGAHHYIDTATATPAAALQALGGARVILPPRPIPRRSRTWSMDWGRMESWSSSGPAWTLSPSRRCNSSLAAAPFADGPPAPPSIPKTRCGSARCLASAL
jgi:D-arabinose 1-dehydrogenase-like Zn-dependent alcohol dehydrogenase